MRALISGLVGAAASSAAWLAAEHFQQASYGWMVCLVGIVTGVCVHWGSSKHAAGNSSAGFGRGALAIILTLAGIAGGQKVYAMVRQAGAESAAAGVVQPLDFVAETADESATADADAAAVTQLPLRSDMPELAPRNYSKSAIKKNFSDWDMIWMCVAALAAYVTGKGGGATAKLDDEAAVGPAGTNGDAGNGDAGNGDAAAGN